MPEQNAGGVRRYEAAGGVVVRAGLVLVLRRPRRDEVRLPKGHIELGETPEQTALRETREESGYAELALQADLGTQVVTFPRGEETVLRGEHYFLMGLAGAEQAPSGQGEAQFEPQWLEWGQALETLTFEVEREWVRRAREAVGQRDAARVARGQRTIALSTGSLYTYGIDRVFGFAAEAGYDGVEVLIDQRQDTRDAVYMRRLASRRGVPVLALHSPFVPVVPEWPSDQLGRLRRTVAMAQELGAPVVVTHLPIRLNWLSVDWRSSRYRRFRVPMLIPYRDAYTRFVHDGVVELEEASGVIIGIENMPSSHFMGLPLRRYWFNTVAELSELGHLTLDTTHLGTWGMDLLGAYGRLRERLVHVHLSNFDGREHRAPAEGDLALAALLQRLAADRFGGTVTVECDPAALDAEEPARALQAVRDALDFCRRHLRAS